ncbi:kinase-like domain-containing protein [Aspergillus cavernicola]|uniref:Kinase-like domain-containing protein n=1 Tax=Aspergillus cavernicola TaxID=176166 RepID=A0ABR4I051_9EURO
MEPSPSLRHICHLLNARRVENVHCKKFIPEGALFEVLVEENIRQVLKGFVTSNYDVGALVDNISKSARKVFSILVLIDQVSHIMSFFHYDQLQNRCMDHLLPFERSKLRQILEDETVADLFYEKQWELCVPAFLGDIIPRNLDRHTIMPYLTETDIGSGGYGSVYKVEFHPSYRPKGFEGTVEFVRKEQKLDDTLTYENEVRVLSTLQRLAHPNILRLVACYTHDGKHNLVSPFIAGGTLREYVTHKRPESLTREKMLCSMAGLASAIWALHIFALEDDTQPAYKGHHQDLWGENILVDGDRFILADFGLSSIKKMNENTPTRFKGRKGYYQAPECADLNAPFHEYKASRASDIFALGCIFTDLLVYFVFGPKGVKQFAEAREFTMTPLTYKHFHKSKHPHEQVEVWLQRALDEDQSESTAELVCLIQKMLELSPANRPRADEVTAIMYVCAIKAFSEKIVLCFARFDGVQDAMVEKARYLSWALTQEAIAYLKSSGATAVEKEFTAVVRILTRMLKSLESIGHSPQTLDRRSFLEIQRLNLQLLNMLSPSRRALALSNHTSILFQEFGSVIPNLERRGAQFDIGYSSIISKARTKQLVAWAKDDANAPSRTARDRFSFITDQVIERGSVGQFKTGTISHHNPTRTVSVFIETIKYYDFITWENQAPRIRALCDLLWSEDVVQNFRIPPFYGVRERRDDFTFDLLYQYPNPDGKPISLHSMLSTGDPRHAPLESRFNLAAELADALADFHDVNWFHKDLTSSNVLFFTSRETPLTDQPYLVGFQHSRRAAEDSSEGPLQDPRRQRYHNPSYVSTENWQFTGFRPEFDRYSLGILLLEIGLWSPIDVIMRGHESVCNREFSRLLIAETLPQLSFSMGFRYTEIVRQCLNGLHEEPDTTGYTGGFEPSSNILFKQAVATPLRSLATRHEHLQTRNNKRKSSYEEGNNARGPVKLGRGVMLEI